MNRYPFVADTFMPLQPAQRLYWTFYGDVDDLGRPSTGLSFVRVGGLVRGGRRWHGGCVGELQFCCIGHVCSRGDIRLQPRRRHCLPPILSKPGVPQRPKDPVLRQPPFRQRPSSELRPPRGHVRSSECTSNRAVEPVRSLRTAHTFI